MCSYCGWIDALDTIDSLIDDPNYEFALETIENIRNWVSEHQHMTERQYNAIENIRKSVHSCSYG